MTTSEQNTNVMPSIPAHYKGTKQSSKEDLNLNHPLPDEWCHLISQSHIMPALFDHDFGGNRERGRNQILKYIKANLKLHWRLKNA